MARAHHVLGLLATAGLAVGTLPGCYRDAVYVSNVQAEPRPAFDETRAHLFFGLADVSSDIDLRAQCPQGIARVEHIHTFWNGLLSVVTLGVYTPTNLAIYCQQVPGGPGAVAP